MSVSRKLSLAERLAFYSMPEPNSGCWLWLGAEFVGTSYGRMSWRGKSRLTHRLSWLAHRGEIPTGLFVCHKCDVPACINPDHLFLGTHAENMRDRKNKGRSFRPQGERHNMAKLTSEAALSIRKDRRPAKILSAEYGVTPDTIYHIRSGLAWRHLNG